jgi:HlyD family secretion protein
MNPRFIPGGIALAKLDIWMRRPLRSTSHDDTRVYRRDRRSPIAMNPADASTPEVCAQFPEIHRDAAARSVGGVAPAAPWLSASWMPSAVALAPAHSDTTGAVVAAPSIAEVTSFDAGRSLARGTPSIGTEKPGHLAHVEQTAAVYSLVRRIALQQDLQAADRVLRVGLAELTAATTCSTWYLGADQSLFSLEGHPDPGGEQAALVARALVRALPRISDRVLVLPVVAAGQVIAAAVLTRAPRQVVFSDVDVTLASLALQEASGLLYQLLARNVQAKYILESEARSQYRPEALANQRQRGGAGALVHLSPRWLTFAYPAAVLTLLAASVFAFVARAPTYSSGVGIVSIEGFEVTSPGSATVASIRVQAGQPVRAGEELMRLVAQDERSAFDQSDREYSNALATLLFDGPDVATRSAVAAAATARQRARDKLDARILRSPADAVVGDVRAQVGAALALGDQVLTLLRSDAEPTALVFLSGRDRPRLRPGQILEIELEGYTKIRERAIITEVGSEVIGPAEARRVLKQRNADAVPLSGAMVMVRARLPGRTFRAGDTWLHYHDGMPIRGEVKVESQPFIVTLFPSLGRFL